MNLLPIETWVLHYILISTIYIYHASSYNYMHTDTNQLLDHLHSHVAKGDPANRHRQSVFTLRTDDVSSEQYFSWYSSFAMQQTMLKVCYIYILVIGLVLGL